MYHSTNSTNVMVNFMNSLNDMKKRNCINCLTQSMVLKRSQVGLPPQIRDWFNIQKPINVIYHIHSLRKKHYKIISIDIGKTLDKI